MRSDVIPLVVGLSLCGASAALLYIWFQTRDTEDECDAGVPSKLRRTSSKTPASASLNGGRHQNSPRRLECVIPNSIVPLVQGRSGANVRAIEEATGCRITFREKDENSQVCEISGNGDDVQKAAEMVRKEATPLPIITEEIVVPLTACGKIIGRCGEALQEICRQSMAKVYVDSGERNESHTRRVLITGTRSHVNLAKQMIEEKIRIDSELRKTVEETESKREPRGKHSGSDSHSSNVSLSGSMADLTITQAPRGEKLPSADGGQLEVYVSAIASPSRFWLQLVGPQSMKLDKLVEEMTGYYEAEENRQVHKIADPYLGQIVAALFKYDGKWYRGEIVGILPNEFNPRKVVLDLYFVDFGDSEYVSPHEVYELRTDFLTLRFQAIECFLANVKSTNPSETDVWKPDAISRFEEVTHVAQWQKMHARIVTTKKRKYGDLVRREGSPVPGVELFESADGLELNIASLLLREGHAIEDIKEATPSTTSSASSTPPPPPVGPPPSTSAVTNGVAALTEQDKFSAICENTTNENYENTQIDSSQQQRLEQRQRGIDTFIEAEKRQLLQRQNGTAAAAAAAALSLPAANNSNDVVNKTNAMLRQATTTR